MALKRNVIANYLGQGWTALMGLAFIPLYIKYLGIEAYGLIGLFAVLQAWLSLLDMGIVPTLGREMARFTAGSHSAKSIHDLLRSLETITVSFSILIGAAFWLASDWLANNWLRSENLPVDVVAQALAIMGLVAALRFCEGIYRSALIGLQHQVWYNSAQAAIATLRFGGAVAVLAYYRPTIEAFFIWQAVVSLAALLLFVLKLRLVLPRQESPAVFSISALRTVWQFASGMMGINFLKIMLTQIDKVLLSRLLSLEHFGYYMLASTVSTALFLLIGPITQALYPRMVQLNELNNQQKLITVYHLGAQLVTVVTSAVLFVLIVFGEGVIYAWSGDIKLSNNVGPILSVLVLGSFLNGLMWMPYQCQLAHGWVKLGVVVNLVAVLLLVPAIVLLVPKYGALGAAWLWVTLNAGYVLLGIHFMHRKILPQEKWRWYWQDVAMPALGSGSILALALIVEPKALTGRFEWFIFLLVTGLMAVAAASLFSSEMRRRICALL
ncbi:MAG: oligosaccharide flippase family protein [Sideroxyarcus sp.]